MYSITLFLNQDQILFYKNKYIPKESTWTETINLTSLWDDKKKLYITTNIKIEPFEKPKTIEDFNIGLLKSSLQKSVRRRKTEVAINLAWQLLCQDQTELLRRLPIIVLEDSVLHPLFPHLIWCMIAESKGWKLTKSQVEVILQIVYDISNVEYRDNIPHDKENFKNPLQNNGIMDEMIASIILRANYGGMKGDINFLKSFAILWHKRLNENFDEWNSLWKNLYPLQNQSKKDIEDLISKKPLVQERYRILEGIDHHNYPNLIDEAHKLCESKGLKFQKKDIERLVWYHKSGVNVKKFIKDKNNKIEYTSEIDDQTREESKDDWNLLKDIWYQVCTEKYWYPIQFINSNESPKGKKRKEKEDGNQKITKFFKFVK